MLSKEIRAAAMTIGRAFCVLVAAVCLLAIGLVASYWYPWPRGAGQPAPEGADTEPPEKPRIEAQGRLEPISGTLSVAALPGEEIVQLDAHVGQRVQKDDVLAVLGSQELRNAERVLAEQQLEKATRSSRRNNRWPSCARKSPTSLSSRLAARAKEIPPEESIRRRPAATGTGRVPTDETRAAEERPADAGGDRRRELEQQRLLIRQIQVDLDENRAKREAARESQVGPTGGGTRRVHGHDNDPPIWSRPVRCPCWSRVWNWPNWAEERPSCGHPVTGRFSRSTRGRVSAWPTRRFCKWATCGRWSAWRRCTRRT